MQNTQLTIFGVVSSQTKPKPLIVVQENAGCGFADERWLCGSFRKVGHLKCKHVFWRSYSCLKLLYSLSASLPGLHCWWQSTMKIWRWLSFCWKARCLLSKPFTCSSVSRVLLLNPWSNEHGSTLSFSSSLSMLVYLSFTSWPFLSYSPPSPPNVCDGISVG